MRSMTIYVRMVLLVYLGADPALAQDAGVGAGRIGSAYTVKGTVESNVQGRTYPLTKGGTVYWQQFVNTRAQSDAGFEMINQSSFHVGPNTRVKLDKPQWNPKTQNYHVSLHMLRNTPESASARIKTIAGDRTHYSVHTPDGVLSVTK